MYSPSRAHSPVHALRSRPPTSYRRYFPFFCTSSRTRIHPLFLIPVFLLGTIFSNLFNGGGGYDEGGGVLKMRKGGEPIYRKEDYDWNPEEVFMKPDAPPLVKERVGDEYGTGSRGAGNGGGDNNGKVLARNGHGQGADEWEWWDPTSTSSTSDQTTRNLYYERQGLLYYTTSPSTILPFYSPPDSNNPPEFPLAKPRIPPVQKKNNIKPEGQDRQLTRPEPPSEWLQPGDVFKSPDERRTIHQRGGGDSNSPVALHAPLPPRPRGGREGDVRQRDQQQARGNRQPIGQRIPQAERDATRRRIGANAQAAQKAKKEGKGFVPGKPQELLEAEKKWEQLQEKKRRDEESRKNRGAVWAVVEPPKRSDEEGDGEEEDLDDEAILEAVRGLSEEERKYLSLDELALIAELEAQSLSTHHQQGGDEGEEEEEEEEEREQPKRRKNFRDRDVPMVQHEVKRAPPPKPVFKPMQGGGGVADRRNRGGKGLRKRSFGSVETPDDADETNAESEEKEEDDAKSFVRRGLEEEDSDSPSLSNSDRSGQQKGNAGPVDRLHPIQYLVEKAEEEWEEMLRRQSQTLEQAVEEYERRYRMKPPVGFDSWWRYAMENRVILVDEYDQIYSDLLPFHALSPTEFRRRSKALQTDTALPWYSHSFGLGVKSGVVKKYAGGADGGTRMEDLMDILGEFAEMLPEDVEMRFLQGDEAGVVVSGEARERLEDFAQQGKFLSSTESLEILEPSGFTPWDSLCKPNSTARRISQSLPVDRPVVGANSRSLVNLEHAKSMDLCEHPELRDINGVTNWAGPRPYLLYPIFASAKTALHSDLLVPSISNDFYVEVGRDPSWEGKRHNKVLWRGDATGAWHAKGSGWKRTQRARLVAFANSQEGETVLHYASSPSDALRRSVAPTSSVNSFYFDIAYSGRPLQCSVEDKTCGSMQGDSDLRWDLRGEMKPEEQNQYKYVLDVDANYQSGNFKRLMSSRSLVLKSTIFPEWWSRRIMPWYHYIPVKSDYSDLVDISSFFIGAPDGTGSHDLLAKTIAARGQKWSKEHWREVDMAAYMFRLYLEYARLLNRDEKDPRSMDYSP